MKVDFADGINVMQGIDQNIFKGLTETLTELNLNDTENGSTSESSSQEASSLMFEEGILIGNRSLYDNSHVDPLHININLSKVKIYLHDGYDWKDTRKAIRGAVKNFETAQTAQTVAKEKEKSVKLNLKLEILKFKKKSSKKLCFNQFMWLLLVIKMHVIWLPVSI